MLLRSCAFLLLALAALCIHAQTPADVPAPLRSALDRGYPGWSFGRVDADITARLREQRLFPNLVFGDFNGDGRRDAAVKIGQDADGGRKQTVLVFLNQGNGFTAHVVDTGPETSITYLTVQPKGTEDYDFSAEKTFTYAHDTVMLVFDGKGSVSYLFENGKFRKVISGD